MHPHPLRAHIPLLYLVGQHIGMKSTILEDLSVKVEGPVDGLEMADDILGLRLQKGTKQGALIRTDKVDLNDI